MKRDESGLCGKTDKPQKDHNITDLINFLLKQSNSCPMTRKHVEHFHNTGLFSRRQKLSTAPLNVTAIVSLKKHRAQKSVSTKSEVSFNMILKKKKLEQG